MVGKMRLTARSVLDMEGSVRWLTSADNSDEDFFDVIDRAQRLAPIVASLLAEVAALCEAVINSPDSHAEALSDQVAQEVSSVVQSADVATPAEEVALMAARIQALALCRVNQVGAAVGAIREYAENLQRRLRAVSEAFCPPSGYVNEPATRGLRSVALGRG
mmetsp:Transcript_2453/g.5811  ORF Transcript_2453/g.5811 Transcript_2453/m.5811 type:complete len:162 (+) Transcript_2453:70-555(+)